MNPRPYNLLDEPWIEVLDLDGRSRAVSISSALTEAHLIADIKGDLVTQDVALLRLLLAILRRALLEAVMQSDDLESTWASLRRAPTLPLDLIGTYLEGHRDRFDLLHPQTPFFQIVRDTQSKRSGLQKAVADLADSADKQQFSNRAGAGAQSLPLAEAARWLVHIHAFDPSGIKTGLVGDSRAKGGKGYPIGLGWSGNCGVLMARGATLKDTLILNLVLPNITPEDKPPWELPQDGPDARITKGGIPAFPAGPTQAMVWQSRRVMLHLDEVGENVVDISLGNGDPVSAINQWNIEDHTAWRHSPNQSKRGPDVFFPRGIDPTRGLWRGISGVLAVEPTRGRVNSKPAPKHIPGLVSWLHELIDARALPVEEHISLRVTGAIYGTQNSVVDHVMADDLVLPAAVVTDERLQHLAVNAVADAEQAVAALRGLARDLCRAAGLEATDEAATSASDRAYFALDAAYPTWLAGLVPGTDRAVAARSWQMTVGRAMNAIAADLIRDAGTAALIGRRVERLGGKAEHLDVGSASRRFTWGLRRTLGLIYPAPAQKEETDG